MKKGLAGLIIAAAIFALVISAASIQAADAGKSKEPNAPVKNASITVKGKVSVIKDAKGNVTAVKLLGDKEVTYNVTLDAQGKELGEKMAHKMVEATGVSEVKDNVKWLTVEKYSESQQKTPKKGKKNKTPN